MTKATSDSPRKSRGSQIASTERKAAKVVSSAQQEATRARAEAKAEAQRLREDAEEHARRLVLDARATADGVRAEGMEVVSNLRQISDTLRELSDRVLEDVEAIHARMVQELEKAAPSGGDGPTAGVAAPGEPAAEPPAAGPGEADAELDVPDFVSRS